jgi:hypothetical protein
LGEKLGIFIEFKKEILWTYVLRMTGKGRLISIKERAILPAILSEAKNLLLLLSFSPRRITYFKILTLRGN